MTDPWTERLSEYLDDELDHAARRELEKHLRDCAACRGVLAELRQVVARGRALDDRPPARDLWPHIAAGIGAAAPATRPPVRAAVPQRWRRLVFSVPQLAAAGVALAIVSGGTVWLLSRRSTPAPHASGSIDRPVIVVPAAGLAEGAYQAAVRDLERALAEGRTRLDTATVRVLEQSLRTIDAAILEARRALAQDPASAYLNQHLAETMRRKVDLLRRAATLALAES